MQFSSSDPVWSKYSSAVPTSAAMVALIFLPLRSSVVPAPPGRYALRAIAKARVWVDDLVAHRVASFAEIAAREGKGERYIRLLATLAFAAPGTIVALIDGTARADLSVTALARALPYSWAEQERLIGLAPG
jgi:site-specific DNA recombinase